MIPGYIAVFAAGLLSFLSPCVLPLIPIYLSFMSGQSVSSLKGPSIKRFTLFVNSMFFVSGFTIVFVLLAVIFGGGMRFLGSSASLIITRIAGSLVILLGLNTLFDFIPLLRGEMRMSAGKTVIPGKVKSVLLGMAFAAGWSPCIGPILSSILLYAGNTGNIAHASILLALYSMGLGIPFILVGIFFDRAQPLLLFFKRHMKAVKIVSGILLVAFGFSIITGSLANITTFFLKAGYSLGEYAEMAPALLRPVARVISGWLTFQGL